MGFTKQEDARSTDVEEVVQEIADVLTKVKNQTLNLTDKERVIFDTHVREYNTAVELSKRD